MFSQKINYSELIVPNGDILPCAIEQFPSKDFFQNECGWTRNDIAVLAATTSKSQYDAIVQRLVERTAEFNLKPDTKLVDAYKTCVPRWCQSPMELANFAEYAANLQLSDVDDAYLKMRPEQAEKTEKSQEVEKAE